MIQHCLRCPNRSCGGSKKPRCAGVMLCTISGRDIIEHATSGQCPENRFTEPLKQSPPTPPRPIHEWPLAARAIAALRGESDKGLGDTIHRHLQRFGADAMKRLYRRVMGRDCGCGDRQVKLNRMFPYDAPRT